MRKLIFAFFLVFCAISARAQSPAVHLSGIITDTTGAPNAGTVTLTLGNYGSNAPVITGHSELAPTSATVTANGSGVWSISVYGSDQINPINTTWTVTIMAAGSNVPSWNQQYVIKTGTYDLSNLIPISTTIPPQFQPVANTPGPAGPAGPTGASGTLVSNSGITVGGPAIIKGPGPYADITAFGARAVASPASTTASCVGTTAITLAAASTFQNGDGIVIYGCGPTQTLTAPSAPTVTPGVSDTLTVPDAILTTDTSGSSTYKYKLVARDQFGGMAVPTAATTITDGEAALGMTSVSVTSESLAGTSLTIVLPSGTPLGAGDLIHVKGSTNATLSGWFQVSSVSGGGATLVINNTYIDDYTASAITSTGGTLTYAVGNQLTWTGNASVWEYIVCGSRPADSGAYHVIGLSYPNTANGYASSTAFTDWGATVTSAPTLPAYITDSVCTAGSATNDYLSTTIASGAGTTSIVVANAAAQTASGKTALFDDGPAIVAASSYASANYGVVLIPPTASGYYYVNSFTNLEQFTPLVALHQAGVLILQETLYAPSSWTGVTGTGPGFQFSSVAAPLVSCNGGWPCVYTTGVPEWNRLSINNQAGANQSLLALWDNGTQGGFIRDVNISTGGGSDYSGLGLVVRPGAYNFTLDTVNFNAGPGDISADIDTTWTPEVFFDYFFNFIIQNWTMKNVSFTARTFFEMADGGAGLVGTIDKNYTQGSLMPLVTVYDLLAGVTNIQLQMNNFTNDTSNQPHLALLGSGQWANTVTMQNLFGISVETGGIPPYITGNRFGNPTAVTFIQAAVPATNANTTYATVEGFDVNGTYAPFFLASPITVSQLPVAAAGNAGQVRRVTDSTTVSSEGQTCIGSSTNSALAFSNGSVWKCF